MMDSWGDGWNGTTYVIQDGSGATIYTGTLASGSLGYADFCLPSEGGYTMAVGESPATPGGWMYEISWPLSDAETG